jgi:hypothetical protein
MIRFKTKSKKFKNSFLKQKRKARPKDSKIERKELEDYVNNNNKNIEKIDKDKNLELYKD